MIRFEEKKFACLLRGGRVNAGEVLRALDSHARHELVFISPQMGLPPDGVNGLGIILFRYADWLQEKGRD